MHIAPSQSKHASQATLASDTPGQRVFDARKLIEPTVVTEIYGDCRRAAPGVFGGDLVFAFIFGGFAKGYAVQNQDVDIFVCARRAASAPTDKFRSWYFDLHARYDLIPDRADPGEVMSPERLEEKLLFAAQTPVRAEVQTYYEYEAIVWADILCGEKAAVVGDARALMRMTDICDGLPQRWRRELLGLAGTPIEAEIAKLPTTRLFRKFVRYLKQGDNTKPVQRDETR